MLKTPSMQKYDSISRGCGLRARSSHPWTHAVPDVPILTTEIRVNSM